MAEMAPESSLQSDAKEYYSRMQELLKHAEDLLFTSYDAVCESFDDMAIQENLFRGIYTYGINTDTGAAATTPVTLGKGKKKRKRKRKARKARSTPDRAAQPQQQE